MDGIQLEFPNEVIVSVGITRSQLRAELIRRVVAAMYADDVVGGSATCMLPGLEKSAIRHWGCGGDPVIPLGAEDYALERRNLHEWLAAR